MAPARAGFPVDTRRYLLLVADLTDLTVGGPDP